MNILMINQDVLQVYEQKQQVENLTTCQVMVAQHLYDAIDWLMCSESEPDCIVVNSSIHGFHKLSQQLATISAISPVPIVVFSPVQSNTAAQLYTELQHQGIKQVKLINQPFSQPVFENTISQWAEEVKSQSVQSNSRLTSWGSAITFQAKGKVTTKAAQHKQTSKHNNELTNPISILLNFTKQWLH
ncbi:hypothetical protein [Motilimonas pumila]|uniref:Uncharacterized protein n=1 Tax=Motilimonas pumila TaxID=2303987 RepID=A0A418YAQ4_9GAMM|nr:hypothetical protein [Motilimonas pumila]RJG40018.1 hypothetical protein D1Z90_17630 [Motilimonas pumila]